MRLRALWILTLDAVTYWRQHLPIHSSHIKQGTVLTNLRFLYHAKFALSLFSSIEMCSLEGQNAHLLHQLYVASKRLNLQWFSNLTIAAKIVFARGCKWPKILCLENYSTFLNN